MSQAVSRRTLLRSAVLLPLAGAGSSFLLSACGSDDGGGSGSATAQTFTTSFGFVPSYVELMVAKEQGFFEKAGVDVTVRGAEGTSPAVQALLSNSAQYTRVGGITQIISNAKQPVPLRAIGTVYQRSQYEIISMPDKPIKSPKDMQGKKIGVVSTAGTTEFLVMLMAAKAGIPLDQIQRPVTGAGAAAYQLASKGSVDAWVGLTTDRLSINKANNIELAYFNTDDFCDAPADSVYTTVDLLDSGSDAPKKVLTALAGAMEFAADPKNAEKCYESVQKYNPDVKKELLIGQLPTFAQLWTAGRTKDLLSLTPDTWTACTEQLLAAKIIDKKVELDGLIREVAWK